MREGLTALISVKLQNPQFEGQTKTKLGNTEIRTLVETSVNDKLAEFLEENPTEARQIVEKAINAARARERGAQGARPHAPQGRCSRAARCPASWPTAPSRTRRSARSTSSRATRPAAPPSRRATARFQAILPLRGKIINVEKARIDKMLANQEILTMISAIGAGIGEEFDVEQARYHKIIIMTDADVDGSHIRTLILTFLFRHMRPLVDAGYVYIAQPPLYRLKQGNQETYIHKEAQARGDPAARPPRADPRRQHRHGLHLQRDQVPALPQALRRVRGLGQEAQEPVGRRAHRLAQERPVIEADIADFDALLAALREDIDKRYVIDVLGVDDEEQVADTRLVERRTGLAANLRIPFAALAGREFQSLKRVHVRIAELVGRPPFTLHLGNRKSEAASYEELRVQIVELTKEGMQLQRFKGLGEMNPDQLWETTMNPRRAP